MRAVRALALVVGLTALSAAAGCRAPMGQPAEARRELGPDAVVLEVAPVAQEQSQACGLACLTALLRYHGLDLDDEARRRFSPERLEREPIAAGELRDYLAGRGFRVALVHGTLDERAPTGLIGLVRRRLPVVFEIVSSGKHHYGLAIGFDTSKKVILVMDPALGIVALPDDNFERAWAGADHFMLVAAPRPVPATTTSPGGS